MVLFAVKPRREGGQIRERPATGQVAAVTFVELEAVNSSINERFSV